MIQSLDELQPLIRGGLLDGREMAEIPVLDTGEVLFAVRVDLAQAEACWRAARQLVSRTGRWPVMTTFWVGGRLVCRVRYGSGAIQPL